MSEDEVMSAAMVDVAIPLRGRSLPRDHAEALAEALCRLLPWLAAEPTAGIHPVKLVPGGGTEGLLSGRARLLMRLPREREGDLGPLAGCSMNVGRCDLLLGAPKVFDLLPHSTLYAPMVAADSSDEAAFIQAITAQLKALDVEAQCVCGKARQIHREGTPIAGFSLMLHGLKPAHSLLILQAGLGPYRSLGCGIFVPHRSAAAVGN